MTSMWVTRWILVTLSGALAVALIVHGNVVIGALIGALALGRAARLTQIQRRRRRFRRRHIARGAVRRRFLDSPMPGARRR